MHNCKCPSASRKPVCPHCVYQTENKHRQSASFKSSSFFDVILSNSEYASSSTNSQASQNISTQTNFKSSTSVNLRTYRKVDIYRERCTQTSKTVLALNEINSPRFSPDSLSPKHEFPVIDETGDNPIREQDSLTLIDLDYIPFERKLNLNHYLVQCETESQELLTGDALTKAYLSKNQKKLPSSQAWLSKPYPETNKSLKSQSFVESPSKRLSSKGTKKPVTRFKVKKVKEKTIEAASSNTPPEKNKRSLSFMSPTISSESKDQSLEIESIQKLISPTRKGRSCSPINPLQASDGAESQAKKVPYIDSSNATLKVGESKNNNGDEQLVLNLKHSYEVSLRLNTFF